MKWKGHAPAVSGITIAVTSAPLELAILIGLEAYRLP
jgi:hypothetical protein